MKSKIQKIYFPKTNAETTTPLIPILAIYFFCYFFAYALESSSISFSYLSSKMVTYLLKALITSSEISNF